MAANFNSETSGRPEPVLNPKAGPAADLFKSKYGFASSFGYVYPQDLYSSGRAHSVVFDIFDVAPLELKEVGSFVQRVRDTITKTEQETTNAGQGFGPGVSALTVKEAENKGLFSTAVDYLSATGTTVKNLVSGGPRTKSSASASIALYMPETLNFNYEASYNDIASLSGALGSLTGGIGQRAAGIADNEAVRVALNAAGYVFNQQRQVLFDGINFRDYEMNFTFTPASAQETEIVKEIIKTFRKHAAPEIGGVGGFFFTPPSVFNVSFKYAGKRNEYINLLKKSVLKTVNVNYAPNGWAAFEGTAAPVQITLALQFQEIILVDKKDIDLGF
jgi:hypothetical protein